MKQVQVIRVKGQKRLHIAETLVIYNKIRTRIRWILNRLADRFWDSVFFNKYSLEKLFARKLNEQQIFKLLDYLNYLGLFKQYREIKEQSSSIPALWVYGIVHEWVNNFKSIIKLRQKGQKTRLPKAKREDTISVSLDGNLIKQENNIVFIRWTKEWLPIKLKSNNVKVTSVRVIYYTLSNEIEFHIVYEDLRPNYTVEPNDRWLSIDLGVKNFIATISNVPQLKSFIVSSGWLLSLYHWAQKLESIAQSNKLKKLRSRINSYVKRRVKTTLHQLTNKIVDLCLAYDISKVIVGKNVIYSNKHSKQNHSVSKLLRWKLHKLPFRLFVNLLTYKLKKFGIQLVEQDESYTSKLSSITNTIVNRTKRGLVIDKTLNKAFNADINGALNIAKKHMSSANIILDFKVWKTKLCNPVKFSFSKFMQFVKTEIYSLANSCTRLPKIPNDIQVLRI